jgi:hypothetical protein
MITNGITFTYAFGAILTTLFIIYVYYFKLRK